MKTLSFAAGMVVGAAAAMVAVDRLATRALARLNARLETETAYLQPHANPIYTAASGWEWRLH